MCDDPSNQERNNERLFEEEIELKWEKGGSGLVFYTDAQYWKQQEGGIKILSYNIFYNLRFILIPHNTGDTLPGEVYWRIF